MDKLSLFSKNICSSLLKIKSRHVKSYHLPSITKHYPQLQTINTTDKKSKVDLKNIDLEDDELPPGFTLCLEDLVVIPDFISDTEHDAIVVVCEKKLKRLANYEENHIDSVIHNYRECQVSDWYPYQKVMDPIVKRVHDLFDSKITWLPAHVLDLHEEGEIKPHVDNIEVFFILNPKVRQQKSKLSGSVIAGLCLLSDTIVRFEPHPSGSPGPKIDLLAPKKGLYIQRNSVRYNFTHAIPNGEKNRYFKGQFIKPARRIAMMFRDFKPISLETR